MKVKYKKSADIAIDFIIRSVTPFYLVSDKLFFSGLSLLAEYKNIRVDRRLKNIHGLEVYVLDISKMDNANATIILQKYPNALLGYFHNSIFFIHHNLYYEAMNYLSEIQEIDIEVIKTAVNLKEFVPKKVKRYVRQK